MDPAADPALLVAYGRSIGRKRADRQPPIITRARRQRSG
jgi:hypothetical protein